MAASGKIMPIEKPLIFKIRNLAPATETSAQFMRADDIMIDEPYRRLLDNLTTTVVTFDSALRLTGINPAGEMTFGVSAKKVVGQLLCDLLPDGPRLVRSLRRTLTSHHPFTAHGVALRLPDSHVLTVDCTVTPLMTDGTGVELLLEITQIDRLLRLARDENMFDRQAANRAVIRGLAHEIKNPLGGLRGAAQLLERELSDKTLKEYTRIIIHEADRLRNLVDRMTGVYRPMKLRVLNVHEILEHVRRLIEVEVPVGLTILRDYDPSLPEIRGDPEQITQAVLNIVRNALDALENRGLIQLRTRIERQYTIGQSRHRLVVRADVEDNGPGIPDTLRDYIFYPMVTSRPSGTGLGLSIAQDIIGKHGGSIECNTRPGQTIFTIYLPLEPPDTSESGASTRAMTEHGNA